MWGERVPVQIARHPSLPLMVEVCEGASTGGCSGGKDSNLEIWFADSCQASAPDQCHFVHDPNPHEHRLLPIGLGDRIDRQA